MEYAFDRAISVAATYVNNNTDKEITAGQLAFWAEQITEPSLSFTSETEEIMDARNNVVMVLQNGRGATFGASNAFFNTSILAAQTGSKVEDSTGATITKFEMVTGGTDGKATLSYTPASGTTPVVYDLNTDGSFKSATASTATISGNTVTGVKDAKYLVVYDVDAPAGGEKIVALADAENELLDVTAEVLLRDLCNQEIYFAFLFMRGKLSGEAEWGMARDGAHAFEITAMPAYCGDKELVEIVIVKDEDMKPKA